MSTILPDRLAELDTLTLATGAHPNPQAGMCAMEAAAWIAGEPHTDHPECVCPVIGVFLRYWNDDLDDQGRQQLKDLIPLTIGTRGTPGLEERRAWMVTDWLVRVHTPAWLELAGVASSAAALRALPPLIPDAVNAAMPVLRDAGQQATAAWAAARAAAGAAAWDAAGAAARDAAWAAAGAAAGAAA